MFARHFAANFFNLLVIVCIVIAGAVHWAKKQYEVAGPLTSDINFEVNKGDRFKTVAISLEELGIIYSATIFKIGARYAEQDDKLKFGNYLVPRKASMQDVIALITSGRAVSEQVTFPEGFTSYQIVERLNAISELTGKLDILPTEGSLAPNTYSYIKDDTRKNILQKMIDRQNKILDDAWAKRSINLPYNSKKDVLIIASIIEKETPKKEELKIVSGVMMNRLRQGIPLGMDSTIVYEFTKGNPKNMRSIRQSDLVKNTKYNSRRFTGLPPTAIGNPGKLAIEAAVNPSDTDFLYFVADGSGGHVFSKTLEEHNSNVAKWRKVERARKIKQN